MLCVVSRSAGQRIPGVHSADSATAGFNLVSLHTHGPAPQWLHRVLPVLYDILFQDFSRRGQGREAEGRGVYSGHASGGRGQEWTSAAADPSNRAGTTLT